MPHSELAAPESVGAGDCGEHDEILPEPKRIERRLNQTE